MSPSRPWTAAALHELAFGHFMTARVLQVAAELDLFTHLAAGPMPITDLATRLGVDRRGLEALMVACAALQLVEKTAQGYRTAAQASDLLVTGRPANLAPVLAGAGKLYQDWAQLGEAVRTGKSTAPSHRGQDSAARRAFLLEMHRTALPVAQALAGAVDLRTPTRLLDIGSGLGTFALALCARYPDLHATLLDLPDVVAIAGTLLQGELAARVQAQAADYHHDPLPTGHYVTLLCNVLHQEDETQVRRLLRQAHTTLRSRGILVVLDAVLDDDKCGPLSVALGALNQLIHDPGATYYSAAELTGWLRGAGFAKVERKPLPFPNQALLCATKV